MSLWRQITRGIRKLTNRASSDQDVSEELQHFLDEATAEFAARGFSPAEARRAAKIQMGNLINAKEDVRSYGWENIVDTFFADIRYGARQLRRNPGRHQRWFRQRNAHGRRRDRLGRNCPRRQACGGKRKLAASDVQTCFARIYSNRWH